MSAEPVVLGIDLGTSQVKALLAGRNGEILGTGVAGYPVRTPRPGWAECDPEDWWDATAVAVRTAVGPLGDRVRALALVGQMHGVVLTQVDGAAIRPAILWLDRRSSTEVPGYRRLPAEVRSALGNPPSAGMTGPSAVWLRRHEPEAWRRARWLLLPKDWLRLRLTGEAASDPTDASGTLLYDMIRGGWATDVAAAIGLDTALLPPLRQPAEVAGTLRPGVASRLGLPAGVPVAAGSADTAASLLAAALPGPRWGLLTLGTGGQWVVPVEDPAAVQFDSTGRTNLFRAVDGGAYRLAAVQNVGIALDWVTSVLAASWTDLYAAAARAWQPDTPLFLPRLTGERWDDGDGPGGAWEGLSLAHRQEDLMRAALEGVAFLLRAALEDLERVGCRPERIVVAGGGSRDPAWRRLLGEVLHVPMSTARVPWLSALGAALIAGVTAGFHPTWDAAARCVPPPEHNADIGAGAEADQRYQRFRRLWSAIHAPSREDGASTVRDESITKAARSTRGRSTSSRCRRA